MSNKLEAGDVGRDAGRAREEAMSRGHNGDVTKTAAPGTATRSRGQVLSMYDALTAEHRRALRDAPYDIDPQGIQTWPLPELKLRMERLVRESALLAYGPDHPEARRK